MESIIADLQRQVVSVIEEGVTNQDGDQYMKVEPIHTDNEIRLGQYVADNERRIGRIPHAFVFAGNVTFNTSDTTNQFLTVDIPIRVFVATRDASMNDQDIQHKKASKWSIYTAAAMAGKRVRMTATNDVYLDDPNVEVITNTERSSIWEVRVTVNPNIDTELILQEIENE